MNLRFDERLTRDDIEHAVDAIETRVRLEFPHVMHIYLEADTLQATSEDFDFAKIPDPLSSLPHV